MKLSHENKLCHPCSIFIVVTELSWHTMDKLKLTTLAERRERGGFDFDVQSSRGNRKCGQE